MTEQARLFEPPVQVMDGPPVLTAYVGKNAGLFAQIMRLYVPEGSDVLDMTYGLGNFWDSPGIKDRYRLVSMDMERGGVMVHGMLEYPPFKPESFDCVVLDPPYANHGAAHTTPMKESIASTYNLKAGTDSRTVYLMYRQGIYAAAALLTAGGSLLVKCQDHIESGRQHWAFQYVLSMGLTAGLEAVDLFVLVQDGIPAMRHPYQKHARKNHSYFWVFHKSASSDAV